MSAKRRADANIVLCIFPSQAEFLAIDTRVAGGVINVMNIRDVFDDDTCKKFETALSERIRSDELRVGEVMDLAENFGRVLQRFMVGRIFQMVDEERGREVESARSIGLMIFAGEILEIPNEGLHVIAGELFGDILSSSVRDTLMEELGNRVSIERNAKRETTKKIIFGDDVSFQTLWKSED